MQFTQVHLFPLAKFLIPNQTKKFGLTLKDVIIVNSPDKPAGGYYDDEKKSICLNVGALDNPELLLRYQIPKLAAETTVTYLTRIGAAILFEECYHAAHHGTDENTEELATAYGVEQAIKLPIEVLTTKREAPDEIMTETEILKERLVIQLEGGGMADFINKLSRKDTMDIDMPTRFGSMKVVNTEHTTIVRHTTNMSTLDEVKEIMGNITRLGIEYAGMIYVYEEGSWKTLVDVDTNRMAETNISEPTEIHLTKLEGQDPIIELKR